MITCLVNPVSAGGRTASIAGQIREGLESRLRQSVALHLTTERFDARRFVSTTLGSGNADLIVVVGGDGTLQEVANGWMDHAEGRRNGTVFGLVSSGTGQGLAQGLGLPTDHRAQLDIIARRCVRRLDLGHISTTSIDGSVERRWFINECQMGIGGAVVRDVEARGKRRSGRWTFATAAFRRALTIPNAAVSIVRDGKPMLPVSILGLVIGNGAFTGGGMNLTPGASPFDGHLDLLVMRAQTVPQRIANLGRIYSASHVGRPEFSLTRCDRLSVEALKPVEVEADGEFLGTTPCRISLCASALPFIVPPEAL
jgi:YegS/Rv2252/BmrU family lipid kinase